MKITYSKGVVRRAVIAVPARDYPEHTVVVGNRLYWMRYYEGIDSSEPPPAILSVSLSGGRVSTVVKDPGILAKYIASARSYLFWAGEVGLDRSRLDGSDIKRSVAPFMSWDFTGLTASGDYLYFTQCPGDRIGRAHVGSNGDVGPVEWVVTGTDCPNSPFVSAGLLYWVSGLTEIDRVSLSGPLVGWSRLQLPLGYIPGDIAVTRNHLYWITVFSRDQFLGRANLDGTSMQPQFLSGITYPLTTY